MSTASPISRRLLLAGAASPWLARAGASADPSQNLVLILCDGLRWQELFTGVDASLLNKESGGIADPAPIRSRYWRESPMERRELLMPFFWRTFVPRGQVWGNRLIGSSMRLRNPHHFSYPGYSEMITGFVDPRIDSNSKTPNPNVSFLEWLNQRPRFRGRVAAFSSWDVVPFIVNRERSGIRVIDAWDPIQGRGAGTGQDLLNRLKAELPHIWAGSGYDAIVFHSALQYLRDEKPRVVWITLGETDEWAHERHYDRYIHSAQALDRYLQQLYDLIQATPHYRGKTTVMVATDHGRGRTGQDWTSHGAAIPGADEVWLAMMGPNTPPRGELSRVPEITQSQIAATAAAALGEDYAAAEPRAGRPIPGAISP